MNEVKYSRDWECAYSLTDNLISRAGGGGGNLVSGDGFYREYNVLNQLVRIRNGSSSNSPLLEQYYYDPFNERIKIWRNDTAGTVIYTPFRELMQVRNSTGVYNFTYVYDGSTLVARVEPDNNVHYYHPDHLGSTTLITDQSGNVVEETFYEPYGAVTSGGTADVKLYTGQFSDELTNQYYYGARYYLPSIGVYGQADPIIQSIYDPQFLNHYSYVRTNPYLFVDPDGKIVSYLGVKGTVGFLGGASISTGLVVSFSFNDGFQFGRYTKLAGGFITPTLSGSFERGISPGQENLEEFSGNAIDVSGDVGELLTIGFGGSVPFEENEEDNRNYKFKKSSIEATVAPFTDLNPLILPASGQVAQSHTSVDYIFTWNKDTGFNIGDNGERYFVNERTGKRVYLNEGERYDRKNDEIIKTKSKKKK